MPASAAVGRAVSSAGCRSVRGPRARLDEPSRSSFYRHLPVGQAGPSVRRLLLRGICWWLGCDSRVEVHIWRLHLLLYQIRSGCTVGQGQTMAFRRSQEGANTLVFKGSACGRHKALLIPDGNSTLLAKRLDQVRAVLLTRSCSWIAKFSEANLREEGTAVQCHWLDGGRT